jgi:hypothetical protein
MDSRLFPKCDVRFLFYCFTISLTHITAEQLKGTIKVSFINSEGLPEAGIDGGGVFKGISLSCYFPMVLSNYSIRLPLHLCRICYRVRISLFCIIGTLTDRLPFCRLGKKAFGPEYALFSETEDRLLYPNPASHCVSGTNRLRLPLCCGYKQTNQLVHQTT